MCSIFKIIDVDVVGQLPTQIEKEVYGGSATILVGANKQQGSMLHQNEKKKKKRNEGVHETKVEDWKKGKYVKVDIDQKDIDEQRHNNDIASGNNHINDKGEKETCEDKSHRKKKKKDGGKNGQ